MDEPAVPALVVRLVALPPCALLRPYTLAARSGVR